MLEENIMNKELIHKSEEMAVIKKLYYIIDEYAREYDLPNTKRILPVANELLAQSQDAPFHVKELSYVHLSSCMQECKMLIDLMLPVSEREMDLMLAATFGHVLCEIVYFPDHGEELRRLYAMDEEAYRIVQILNRKNLREEAYYEQVKKNKISLIIKLVEMAIITEQFFRLSFHKIEDYIRLDREFFFPMCIYAKEYYPELALSVSTIMEKVKLLADVTEILSRRYRDRRRALIDEMLVLQEENARIRVSIRELEAEK